MNASAGGLVAAWTDDGRWGGAVISLRRGISVAAPALLVWALGAADLVEVGRQPWWVAALLVPQALALLWRRQAPRTVLAVTLAASLVQLLSGRTGNAVIAVYVALSSVVQRERRRRALAIAAAVFGVLGAATYAVEPFAQHVLIHAAATVVAWWFGDAIRQERHVHQTLATRVERLLAGQQLATQTVVLQERLRIGEELHHLVGRALDAVVLRAADARDLLDGGRGGAAEEIEQIERAGRSALGNLDRLLQLLRPVGGEQRATDPAEPPSRVMSPAWTPLRSLLWSAAPTVLLGAIAVIEATALGHARPHLRGWLLALALGMTLPLLVRRRYPITVALLTAAVIITGRLSIDVDLTNAILALPVALHAAAGGRPLRTSSLLLLGTLAPVLLATMPRLGANRWEFAVVVVGFSALAWRIGIAARVGALHVDAVHERAEQLERDRALRVERALAADRIEMAREVHDSVGHALSTIVLVAGAARSAVDQQPDRALDALAAIESSARATLADMDRVLEVFPAAGSASAQPPRLADLPELAPRLRAAGVELTVSLEGPLDRIPEMLQSCAYRIVQEALTNVLKHADAARHCGVQVRAHVDRLDIEVLDDGHGVPRDPIASGGRGTVGMHERAELFGGRVVAGPRPSGGFAVTATFPIPVRQALA